MQFFSPYQKCLQMWGKKKPKQNNNRVSTVPDFFGFRKRLSTESVILFMQVTVFCSAVSVKEGGEDI